MKTNKLVSFALLLGLVFAGVSCKKENQQFSITPTTLNLKIGGIGTITTANASGEITWVFAQEEENPVISYVLNEAKTECTVTALAEGTMTITASNAGIDQTCTVNVTKEVIKTPEVAPTDGKYTIAFRVPAISCDYPTIHMYGGFQEYKETDPDAPKAELVGQEGFENWYKIVFESEDAAMARGKICPDAIDGSQGWNCQAKDYTLVSGDAEIVDDQGRTIVCKSVGSVVYLDIEEWKANPCDAPNPQGTATFNVVVNTEFPEGMDPDDIEISVAFWTPGTVEMTRDLSYTGEGYKFTGTYEDFPANQQYKYNIRYQGEANEWIWEKGAANHIMPCSLVADDVVSDWDETPWNPIPGGEEGTFTVKLSESCNASAYDAVIFTGNFAEEAWENSKREMTDNGDGSWTWTGAYPENFMFKVILTNYDEEGNPAEQVWTGPEKNWKFDGEKYDVEWTCE